MGRECRKYEIEIVAVAGGDLGVEVMDHLEHCSRCADLRAGALSLASLDAPSISPVGAVALARGALRGGDRRRPPLWIAPLLSASTSAAALILYFGLLGVPSSTTIPLSVTGGEAVVEGSVTDLPSLTEITLPEEFEASHDLLFTERSREVER